MTAKNNPFRGFWLLLTWAFLVRAVLVMVTHQYHDLARYELEKIALSLASGDGFANPYAVPTGPTAHASPGYPLLLSVIFRIFGMGVPAEIVKQLLACAVTALQCALIPAAADALGFSPATGVVASLFSATMPIKLATETMGDWEAQYTALALMLVAVLTTQTWQRGDFSMRNAVRTGVSWGASLLFASALMPLWIALLARTLYVGRSFRFCTVQTVVVGLMLCPWAIRNQRELGSFIFTRSNTGIELRVSNNDEAGPLEGINYQRGVYDRYHPSQNVAEAMKVRLMGEVAYNREATAETVLWIKSHPQRFLVLTLERFWNFWFPGFTGGTAKGVMLWMMTGLGLLGFSCWVNTGQVSAWVMGAILVVYPLPNYLIHVGLRHSYSIQWMMTIFGSYFLIDIALRSRRRVLVNKCYRG